MNENGNEKTHAVKNGNGHAAAETERGVNFCKLKALRKLNILMIHF
jgi:hypothetical protein